MQTIRHALPTDAAAIGALVCSLVKDSLLEPEGEDAQRFYAAMSPKEVAELGCAACLKGEAICVPGLANKVIAGGAPLMPRTLVRALGGAINGGGWGRLASALRGFGASDQGARR